MCVHRAVTKWERNGTAASGRGKKRERIGFGRNTALWVREWRREAERMLGEREVEVPWGGGWGE